LICPCDDRKESRKPDLNSIRVLGAPLPTDDGWIGRRHISDRMPHSTVLELRDGYDAQKISLGIVRPQRVLDIEVEPADREWKPVPNSEMILWR
jgi:hypothetical protein